MRHKIEMAFDEDHVYDYWVSHRPHYWIWCHWSICNWCYVNDGHLVFGRRVLLQVPRAASVDANVDIKASVNTTNN